MASAFDRYKQYDLSVLTCDNAACSENFAEEVGKQANDRNIEFLWRMIHSNVEENVIDDISRNSVVAVAFVCQHNEKSFEKVCRSLSPGCKVMICSRTHIKSAKLNDRGFTVIKTNEDMDMFLDKVQIALRSDPLYDDGKSGNDYESGDMLPVPSACIAAASAAEYKYPDYHRVKQHSDKGKGGKQDGLYITPGANHHSNTSDPLYDDGKSGNDYKSGDMLPVPSACNAAAATAGYKYPDYHRVKQYSDKGKEGKQDGYYITPGANFNSKTSTTNTYLELKSECNVDGDEYSFLPELAKSSKAFADAGNTNAYLDIHTLLPQQESTGTYAHEHYLLSRVQDTMSPESLVSQYNRGNNRHREDLLRLIVTKVLKECVEHRNTIGLVVLLKCDNGGIQSNIFDCLEKILYTTEVSRCNVSDVSNAAEMLSSLMKSTHGDHEKLLKMTHIACAMLGVVYLFSIRGDSASEINTRIKRLCQEMESSVSELINDHHSDVLKYALRSLKQLSVSLRSKVNSKSELQIGNWKDALRTEKIRKRFIRDFLTFSDIEIYACVFGVVNQILQNHHTGFSQLVELLKNLVEALIKSSLKKKREPDIFPHLTVVTKALVILLADSSVLDQGSNWENTQCTQEIMNIFSLFLENAKINQLRREYLIMEIVPLLFHRNSSIGHHAVSVLVKNNHKCSSIRQMILLYIEKSLTPLNIHIDESLSDIPRNAPGPNWCSYPTAISNNSEVILHALLPTLGCLLQGTMSDNRHKAEKTLTAHHTNNMDILHHLNREERHGNIITMIAYQCRPLPTFYLTERFNEDNLRNFLLRRRQEKRWLSQISLATICASIIEAVKFIHSKGVIHRNLTAESFSLKGQDVAVLSNFSIAKRCPGNFITDLTADSIPLRWTDPVSILNDQYSFDTDKYMLGQLIYEVYTHGCHPYTELYRYSLESVLDLIMFKDLKPRQWSCIPKNIHKLILSFIATNVEKRASLKSGLQQINDHLASLNSRTMQHPIQPFLEDLKFPKMDENLPLSPQRELPETIKRFKVSGSSSKQSYINLRKSKRVQPTVFGISESDLASPSDPVITMQDQYMDISEPVTVNFYEDMLPCLISNEDTLKDSLGILSWPPQIDREKDSLTLKYRCHRADNIIDIACSRCFGDPFNTSSNLRYLGVISSLVSYVERLHSFDWIFRDICGSNVYLKDGKVFCPRLARMVLLQQETLDDCIIGTIFKERRNWFPLETLQNGQYSKEGDIYMWAMTAFQFLYALEVFQNNPMSSKLKCIPFCRVPKNKLLETLYEGEVPEKPMHCPDWLYGLLTECCNRDRTQRPSATDIKRVFDERIGSPDDRKSWPSKEDHNAPRQCGFSDTDSSSSDYPQTEPESSSESDIYERRNEIKSQAFSGAFERSSSSFVRHSRSRSVLRTKVQFKTPGKCIQRHISEEKSDSSTFLSCQDVTENVKEDIVPLKVVEDDAIEDDVSIFSCNNSSVSGSVSDFSCENSSSCESSYFTISGLSRINVPVAAYPGNSTGHENWNGSEYMDFDPCCNDSCDDTYLKPVT